MTEQIPPIPHDIDEERTPPQSTTTPVAGELERVRQIILGPDRIQRMQSAEVDRLRQVIFGEQMEEYERRFVDFRRDMDRLLTDLRLMQDSVTEFEHNQTKRIDALERDMRRANDELRREIGRLNARETLVQQLTTRTQQQELLGKDFSDNISDLHSISTQQENEIRALKITLGDNREQYERRLDTLRRELRQAEDTLRAELRRVTNRLGDQKTDRKALAAMLMEVATRLETGSSVTGLLEDLTAISRE